jgi:hypothetical protein
MTPTALPPSQVATVASLEQRCDGCGATAKLSFDLVSGGELALCGHHANRLAEGIARAALRIRVEEGFGWQGTPER